MVTSLLGSPSLVGSYRIIVIKLELVYWLYTLGRCASGTCTGSGTLTLGGHLNDSSCVVSYIGPQPSTTIQTMVGSLSLNRTQNSDDCPDVASLLKYNGAAQSFGINNSFFDVVSGVYDFAFNTDSISGGSPNGAVTTFDPGLSSWNPNTPALLTGSCTIDSTF